ncbi:MAG TPA: hypothetical protein VG323_06690 [Thermoanaerobaculia bacterium]|nr:hypothetical protein [Thermoanaerobaculia bacterium]
MRRFLLALALPALLAACPGPRHTDQGAPQTTTTTGNPQAVPENSTAMNPVVPPEAKMPSKQVSAATMPVVQVQLTEYRIEMTDALTPGMHQFAVANAGTMKHNFAIQGPGVDQKLAGDLMRGDTAPMTVNLQKGTYTVFCPVDGHRGRGMSRTITVQ